MTDGAYLFLCFQDLPEMRDCEELFYGVSEDGYNFRVLNGNKPVFVSDIGTKHIRDPFAIKGRDGCYYIVATDMNCRLGWASQSTIAVFKTTDLINMEKGVLIDFKDLPGFEDCNRAWAPEVIWSAEHENADGSVGAYMIYLSLQKKSTENTIGTVMYKCFATDLTDAATYTVPEMLIVGSERGEYVDGGIDGDIIYDPVNERWLMYFNGRRVSESVTGSVEGPYKEIDIKPFDVDKTEGSFIYKIVGEDKWIICADGRAFGTDFRFSETTDFNNYRQLEINKDYSLDFTPRHSCIIHISKEETDNLLNTFGY